MRKHCKRIKRRLVAPTIVALHLNPEVSLQERAEREGPAVILLKDLPLKPLFIPLKTEFFEAFERGDKDTEYRPYGPRWNEKTCPVGRLVTLSHGYGTKRRLSGVIVDFDRSAEPTKTDAWRKCYGDREGDAACVRILLTANAEVS